jgi:tetratricopeptide (TPR) repeat protein
LTTVEWSASRYNVASGILTDNASLFKRVTNHTIRGNYHNEFPIVLRNLATSEKTDDYFQRAITEYEKADHHFKLANNIIYRADVKNNLGFLLYKLSRFKQAHEYLDQARRLTVSIKDKIGVAQIDESRAQVFVAQGKLKEAEARARHAVRVR